MPCGCNNNHGCEFDADREGLSQADLDRFGSDEWSPGEDAVFDDPDAKTKLHPAYAVGGVLAFLAMSAFALRLVF